MKPLTFLSPSEQKATALFLEILKKRFGNRLARVVLFGSTVRQERHDESDVDILVLISNLERKEKEGVWDEATLLNVEWDTMLSPLVMAPEEFQLLKDRERRIALDIDAEGVEL